MDEHTKYCFINTTAVRADSKALELVQAKARAHAATQAYIRRIREAGEARSALIRADDSGDSDTCRSGSDGSTFGTSSSSSCAGSPHVEFLPSSQLVARTSCVHSSTTLALGQKTLVARHQRSRASAGNATANVLQQRRNHGHRPSAQSLPNAIMRGSLDPFFQTATELKVHDLHLLQKCKSAF
jgi:hypothetical protein